MQLFSLELPDPLAGLSRTLPEALGGTKTRSSPEVTDRFAPSFVLEKGSFAIERQLSIELEYQSVRTMKLESGETVYERTSVQFRAFEVYREVGGFQSSTEKPAPGALLDFLRNHFGPERTAERIANFAINRFQAEAEEGAEEATARRERFRNLILPAVRRGADEAINTLAGLPEEIVAIADRVYDLVANLFDHFVEKGNRPVLLK